MIDLKNVKQAKTVDLNGYLLYSRNGKDLEKITVRQLMQYIVSEGLIWSQQDNSQWVAEYSHIFFNAPQKFSFTSTNGDRVIFKKTDSNPWLICVASYDGHKRLIFMTTEEFANENFEPWGEYLGMKWCYWVPQFDILMDIDPDPVHTVPLLSPIEYEDLEQVIISILRCADISFSKKYYGINNKDGIAFFAGASDWQHPERAPLIFDINGQRR